MEHTIQVQKEDMIFNVLSIGEVKSGETANATITGKEPNQILNLTLPKGETGAIGATGAKGDKGDTPIKGTDYWTTSDKQEIVNSVLTEVDIPTSISDLTNDSGFITNAVNDLVNYYLKSESYNKAEVNTLINNITKATISIVDTLPETGESNVIYFVKTVADEDTSKKNNFYDEYAWISNNWEPIGSTDVDLTGYATESWVNTQIANFLTEAQVNTLITNALTNYSCTETDPTVPSCVKSITQETINNWNSKDILPEIGSYSLLANTSNINGKPNNYVIYAIASSNNTIAKRSAAGTLKANNAVESNDLVTLSQLNAIFTLEGATLNITTTNPSTISEEA